MKRNKWKSNYDDKCKVLLGMNHKTAVVQLERKLLLHFGKQLGYGDCYHCGFPIESDNDMSIEHVEPWGGNKAKGLDPKVANFWNMDNLKLSHKRCNCSAANAGTGKYKLIGVNYLCDPRKKIPQPRARASICIGGKPFTLGEYIDPNDAAIAHDLALMFFMKGIGKINFESLRSEYEKYLQDQNVNNERFFRVRNGQIKKAVGILKDKFNEIQH